jgi:hypothetical protein
MEFWNERRPSPSRAGDDERPLDKRAVQDANDRIRAATPVYRQDSMNTRIRTAAVQRHRASRAGRDAPTTVSEYISFVMGADDGGQ